MAYISGMWDLRESLLKHIKLPENLHSTIKLPGKCTPNPQTILRSSRLSATAGPPALSTGERHEDKHRVRDEARKGDDVG
jgi:hypothetical protein